MPPRTAPESRPVPLDRASARLEFDDLLRRRVTAVAQSGVDAQRKAPSGGHLVDAEQSGARLDRLARAFADAVDAENVNRQAIAGPPQDSIEYVDAVVIVGRTTVVVDAGEFSTTPSFYETSAGGDAVEVTFGRDLDGYLRTGEGRYADAIGLR